MAELNFPDIGGNALAGFAMGRQLRSHDDARKQRQQTNMLAGAAYNAPRDQRDAALGQLASVDAGAAVELGGQLQGAEDKKFQKLYGAARYLEQARQSKNPAMIDGAWSAVRPYLQREFPEGQFADRWDDNAMAPVLYKVLAEGGAIAGDDLKSVRVGEDGFYYAVQGGQMVNTGIKAAPQNQILDTGAGIYGINKSNLQAAPVTVGGAPQPGAQPSPAPGTRQYSGGQMTITNEETGQPINPADLPADEQAALFRYISTGQDVTLPPAAGGGQQLQSVPKPAEVERLRLAAEANERANQAAQRAAEAAENAKRGNAPAGFRFRADGSLEPIPGGPKPAGVAASEDERKAAAWLAQADNAYSNMRSILEQDPTADDPGLIETYAPSDELANRSRNPARQQYYQAASSLSEALLRAATGAGITRDEAQQKIRELTPQRGDSDQVKRQKLDAIPVYIQALQQRAGRAAPRQGATPASPDIDALLDKYR